VFSVRLRARVAARDNRVVHGHSHGGDSHRHERQGVDHDSNDRAYADEEHGARGHQHGAVDPSITTLEGSGLSSGPSSACFSRPFFKP
jgi:hypothetical protein